MDIIWLDQRLTLLPQRAVYWHERRTLLVADAHFGKASTFRSAGIPIPRGTTTADLARLESAVQATGAERLVFLGDLLHARAGRGAETLAAVARWRASQWCWFAAITIAVQAIRPASGDSNV